MRGLDLFKEMSKEELQQLWSETMGDEPFPMNRSENSPLDSFYPIDNFIVFMKEGKPISGVGYSTRDGFSLRGGAFTIPEERGEGVYKKVSQEADRIIPTPYIAGFSSSNISSAKWNQTAKDNGWTIKPTDEELGEYANNPTIKAFKDYYDNHPKGASWGVKGLPLKKWFSILKSYRIEMGKEGYNVLDASGKILNYKGLSRSQARAFVKDLQEGKDVSRFTTKPRKSIKGDWFNQLKKWRPDGSFQDMEGTPNLISSLHNTIIRDHYLEAGEERFKDFSYFNRDDMIEEWISKLREVSDKQLRKTKHNGKNAIWFYVVPDEDDFSYIEAHYLGIKNGEKRFFLNSARGKNEEGLPMTYPSYAQFIDIYGTGKKQNHLIGNGKTGFSIFQKPTERTPYSDATTSDEVQEIWNKILAELKSKIDKKTNLFYTSTNEKTKERAERKIKALREEVREGEKLYKKNYKRLLIEKMFRNW